MSFFNRLSEHQLRCAPLICRVEACSSLYLPVGVECPFRCGETFARRFDLIEHFSGSLCSPKNGKPNDSNGRQLFGLNYISQREASPIRRARDVKCPFGCDMTFGSHSTFVQHIESGTCTSRDRITDQWHEKYGGRDPILQHKASLPLASPIHHTKDVKCPFRCEGGFQSHSALALHLNGRTCALQVNPSRKLKAASTSSPYARHHDTATATAITDNRSRPRTPIDEPSKFIGISRNPGLLKWTGM